MNNESKALKMAQHLYSIFVSEEVSAVMARSIADELRRQHAEIESLKAQLAQRVPDVDAICYLAADIRFAKNDDDAQKVIDRIRSMLSAAQPEQPVAHSFKEWFGGDLHAAPHCASCGRSRKDPIHKEQPVAQGEPVAWMRKWSFDGEAPRKERNESGRLAWPWKFKLMPVTQHQCLPDDVPLYTLPQQASKPMTDAQVSNGLVVCGWFHEELDAFKAGVRFAERHHNIKE